MDGSVDLPFAEFLIPFEELFLPAALPGTIMQITEKAILKKMKGGTWQEHNVIFQNKSYSLVIFG